ncbi:methylated-DNA--[protein]-cysteine S-methyltransferase [Bailinhaonella thermotolerans]|uniref:methylated-DNA--[protein]-cysteine S-methyltransferase n=1 Tax=Bailinhaonella thermotolerans TaxID=1070861 RepID=A0A3A4BDC3_9ACTN|nr:methylated-DNA--[protein]-cysteine S-methyltransferase [Bailinhaonella thermotolerans]RJL32208.1 methylated-DNA--[protein]-cysteine S-methyltransferase [Bailinhaonella thermotolerans]
MSSGDLEALLRVTAPGYQPESAPDTAFGTAETPVGVLVVAVTNRGVVACSYEDENVVFERLVREVGSFIGPDPRRIDPVRRELDAYFAGRLRTFSSPIDLRLASSFSRAVLQSLAAIPYGATQTFADVAARLGRPQAVRAVTNAVTANPVCLLVPCHRAVESPDNPGAYAGGPEAKQRLLALESAR